jgi:branched-chain amino acid transport system permease protein
MSLIFEQLVNGLVLGAMLCLISVGLSLILGLMRVVNLAHAALFAVGAYLGLAAHNMTHSFLLGIACSFGGGVILALILEIVFIRLVYEDPDASIILTFGLLLAITEIIKMIWGPAPQLPKIPKELFGNIVIGPAVLPIYRVVVAGLGVLIFIGIWLLIKKTAAGLITRAVLDNKNLVESFGIKTALTLRFVFALASGVAALAGYLAAPMFGIFPDTGMSPLLFSFIAVILGGVGNIFGTAVASILIGLIMSFATLIAPSLGYVTVYSFSIAVLLYRPGGLFVKTEA